MRRREVVAGLFASSLPMPLAAQGRTGRIGYLALLQNERLFNALVRGLEDHGHVLNTNIVIEARSAEGDPARLDEAAAALVAQKPDLIVTVGNAATRAARRAAGAIPIVFAPSGDAVATGMVASLARPGGNLTGLSLDSWILNEKRLEALRDNFPTVKRVAVLANFGNPSGEAQWKMTERGAAVLGFEVSRSRGEASSRRRCRKSLPPALRPCMYSRTRCSLRPAMRSSALLLQSVCWPSMSIAPLRRRAV